MLIDWFTVCAQALNFLILVGLLKRFLYRPVLAAIDAREKKIAEQLQSAAQKQALALAEKEDFQRRNAALDQEREKILRAASDAASQEHDRLLEGARQDARALRQRLIAVVETEREELGRKIQTQTRQEVLGLTRRVLKDLADVQIEQRMVEVFLNRLRGLPPEQYQQILQTNHEASRSAGSFAVVVRSAFELLPGQRESISTQLRATLASDGVTVEFVTVPELVCGIELTVGGTKLAWSVADYLTSVSQELLALVEPVSDAAAAVKETEAADARQ
jgi:F-type H+-transporting ATPase subunit b